MMLEMFFSSQSGVHHKFVSEDHIPDTFFVICKKLYSIKSLIFENLRTSCFKNHLISLFLYRVSDQNGITVVPILRRGEKRI